MYARFLCAFVPLLVCAYACSTIHCVSVASSCTRAHARAHFKYPFCCYTISVLCRSFVRASFVSCVVVWLRVLCRALRDCTLGQFKGTNGSGSWRANFALHASYPKIMLAPMTMGQMGERLSAYATIISYEKGHSDI